MTTENNQQSTPATPTPAATTPATTPETKTPASDSTVGSEQNSGTDLGADDKTKTEGESLGTDLGTDDKPKEGEEAPTPGAEFQGFPETGELEIVAPDGMAVDEELKGEFLPIAKELNLNQKGAQKLIDLKIADNKRAIQRWGNHLKELKVQAQADPDIGGAKYQPAVAASKAVIGKFARNGGTGFRQMLNDYGVGAHPEMIYFLRQVGLATGETPTLSGGEGSGTATNLPLHEKLYPTMK